MARVAHRIDRAKGPSSDYSMLLEIDAPPDAASVTMEA